MQIRIGLAALAMCGSVGCLQPSEPAGPQPGDVAILSFTASPDEIGTNATATLSWTSFDAVACAIDGIGAVDVNGSIPVTPTAETSYALACQGRNGPAIAQTTVAVVLVWYVDGSAPAGGDGTSWATAYDNLDDGIDEVVASGGQLWVAEGSYIATADDLPVLATPPDGAQYYGGFAGGENGLSERPTPLAVTLLDGDRTGDGVTADDSDTVVQLTGVNGFVFDGFTIDGGNAPVSGGGINSQGSTNVTLRNMTLSANNASEGGAIYISGGDLTIEDSTIEHNTTLAYGGGIYHVGGATITISATTFDSNLGFLGGALADFGGSTLVVMDSTFVDNAANGTGPSRGGAIATASTLSITGSTFDSNEVTNLGAFNGGGAIHVDAGTTTIASSAFTNNFATNGGAIAITGGTVRIEDSAVSENTAAQVGGGLFTDGTSASVVLNSTIDGNNADTGGGIAAAAGSQVNLSVVGSTLTGNSATTDGGAAYNGGAGVPTVANSILWGNSAAANPETSGTWTIDYTCIAGGSAGTGNVNLDAVADNPFTVGSKGEFFLKHDGLDGETSSSACVDAGLDATSTGAGIDWENLSTRSDGAADGAPVDAGRHY